MQDVFGPYSLLDRSKNKFSFMHQHVWNSETLRIHYLVAEDGNVEIDVSGTLVHEFDSSMSLLNSLKSI